MEPKGTIETTNGELIVSQDSKTIGFLIKRDADCGFIPVTEMIYTPNVKDKPQYKIHYLNVNINHIVRFW